MGLYHDMEIAAGIKFNVQYETVVQEQRKCENHMELYPKRNEKFCSQCGSEIKMLPIENKFALNIMELTDDRLHTWYVSDEIGVAVSNFGNGSIEIETRQLVEINSEMIEKLFFCVIESDFDS